MVKSLRLCAYCAATGFFCVLWCGLGISYGWLVLCILIFWCVLFAEVMLSGMKMPFEKVAVCIAAGIVVPMLLGAVVRIHATEFGRFFILVPFVLAFLSDTGAYFVGLSFGKHKLAPVISPKKTVEGMFGGIGGAMVGMLIYCLVLQVFFGFRVNYLFALL